MMERLRRLGDAILDLVEDVVVIPVIFFAVLIFGLPDDGEGDS